MIVRIYFRTVSHDHTDALAGAIAELMPSRANGKDANKWIADVPFRHDARPVVINDFV